MHSTFYGSTLSELIGSDVSNTDKFDWESSPDKDSFPGNLGDVEGIAKLATVCQALPVCQ